MTRPQQVELGMNIAVRLLGARARSEHELRTALARKLVPADVVDEVMERLRELRYIDDDAFAQALATSRLEHSHRGRTRIRQELQDKGVARDSVDEVLGQLDPADEWAAARAFATKRARGMTSLEPHVARRRLSGALARRGFGMDIVTAVSREVLDAADDDGLESL